MPRSDRRCLPWRLRKTTLPIAVRTMMHSVEHVTSSCTVRAAIALPCGRGTGRGVRLFGDSRSVPFEFHAGMVEPQHAARPVSFRVVIGSHDQQ